MSLPGYLAEENLRGLALSLNAAIENLAVHDPSSAELAKFHPAYIAYFAIFRFRTNPDLIGSSADDSVLVR